MERENIKNNNQENTNNKSIPIINTNSWISRYSTIKISNELETCQSGNCACLKCHPLEDILN